MASDVPWLAAHPYVERQKSIPAANVVIIKWSKGFISRFMSTSINLLPSTDAPLVTRAGARTCFKRVRRDHKCSVKIIVATSVLRSHWGCGILPRRIQILIILLLRKYFGQKLCWAGSISFLASERQLQGNVFNRRHQVLSKCADEQRNNCSSSFWAANLAPAVNANGPHCLTCLP